MSFTNRIYGSYGDEKATSPTKYLPLGTPMELSDGRMFRYARAGGTTLVAGEVTMGMTEVDSGRVKELTIGSAAVGATSVTVTMSGTALSLDDYADGYLYINDDDGEGNIYKVKASASAAASSTAVFTLADGDAIVVALKTGTSVVGLRQNEFQDLVIQKAGTIGGQPLGIPPVEVTNAYYFWVQRRGAVSAKTAATVLVVGTEVVGCPETNGAVKLFNHGSAATTVVDIDRIGYTLAPCATAGDYSLIYLTLE